ncbi:MAG: Ig-like domain repeat protein [Chloroflexota bacterium]
MKLTKSNSQKSKAQAMVEFAIALPVLLALLYGILETGRFVFLYSTVVNASRQAVRYASATGTGNGTGNATEKRYQDCDGIRNEANRMGFLGRFDTITIGYDQGLDTTTAHAPINPQTYCTSTSAPTDPLILSGNSNRITVTVTKQFVPLVRGLVPFAITPISATSSRSILTKITIINATSTSPALDPSTVTITADTPDPSNSGASVAVTVTVTGGTLTPTGTVSITGADTNCTISLASGTGSCNIVFNSGGAKVITAIYNGDSTHAVSNPATAAHTVNYATVTTITAHTPDPSTTNQNVAVTVTVTSGLAIPNGQTVTITGANTNCTVTLTNGAGSCNVVFTSTGTKTLTATYGGDVNHMSSNSTALHDVLVNNDTITRITSLSPEPSVITQSVTVSVKVIGLTALTGTVTITGGDAPCTTGNLINGTGSCTVSFATAGVKSLTASYIPGDHNPSSGTATHTVNLPATTTTITAHTPNPSFPGPGQPVSVTVSVTGGTTTPTGTVTITGSDTPCTITLPATSCNVVFTSEGTKTLSAVYSGDSLHVASNATATHTVVAPIASPVPSCLGITHGPISITGSTMTMTITNPWSFPLITGAGTVTWNDDRGHQNGSDKSLRLQSIALGSTTVWTGNSVSVSTIPFTTSTVIPANATVTITLTFHQSYDNLDGTENIYINLITPGCENNPIQS